MSRHRARHARAYAAGARDFGDALKTAMADRLSDPGARAAFDRIVDTIRDGRFRMPPAHPEPTDPERSS